MVLSTIRTYVDFIGDLDKRKSLIGYGFSLFGNKIRWKHNL